VLIDNIKNLIYLLSKNNLLLKFIRLKPSLVTLTYSFLQKGKYVIAARIGSIAAKIRPRDWDINFLTGISFASLNRNKEAEKYLRRAYEINSENILPLKPLLRVFTNQYGIENAYAEYHSLLKRNSNHKKIAKLCIVNGLSWAKKNKIPYTTPFNVEKLPFREPWIYGQKRNSKVKYTNSNKSFLLEIPNAKIFGQSSIVLTEDGFALSETAGHKKFGHVVSLTYEKIVMAHLGNKVIVDYGNFETKKIKEGIFLSGLASDAYGHWFPEFLAKLQFYRTHPRFSSIPIIVDSDMPKSHFDSLKYLAKNKLIKLKKNESILCNNLIYTAPHSFLPTETYSYNYDYSEFPAWSPRALDFVRKSITHQFNTIPHRKIYISRGNVRWRKLINEKEIVAYLISKNFEVVYPEKMTFNQQIKTFSEADWIIAPNGSALNNLIFCNKSVKVIILSQGNLFNWGGFEGPLYKLGFKKMIYIANDHDTKNKHNDYILPLQKLKSALIKINTTKIL
jgi:hypothetical protein